MEYKLCMEFSFLYNFFLKFRAPYGTDLHHIGRLKQTLVLLLPESISKPPHMLARTD